MKIENDLTWEYVGPSGTHHVELRPKVFLLSTTFHVHVDGVEIGKIAGPSGEIPWRETVLEVDGERLTFTVTYWLGPQVNGMSEIGGDAGDAFRDGVSVRTGKRIEQARLDAPEPTGIGRDIGRWLAPIIDRPVTLPWIVLLVAAVGALSLSMSVYAPKPLSITLAWAMFAIEFILHARLTRSVNKFVPSYDRSRSPRQTNIDGAIYALSYAGLIAGILWTGKVVTFLARGEALW